MAKQTVNMLVGIPIARSEEISPGGSHRAYGRGATVLFVVRMEDKNQVESPVRLLSLLIPIECSPSVPVMMGNSICCPSTTIVAFSDMVLLLNLGVYRGNRGLWLVLLGQNI